ncbi:MAG: DUF87 domain-containing protein [Lamprobacter sp.]|uniref:ATP-binding protein n=1 Tax=Lamprobacter sp. TaxID=3100796 RepID=UPI002B25E1F8|nr:type IV secretion system DNA-binding domain-containing protein [Lamprobacter sp.]MEA3642425.1 DUF87 domain-containing protein [Lamprobacter sp.]
MHRAIASRARVRLPDLALRSLDQALEQLAEGRFEVCWHGLVFTFWNNVPMPAPAPALTPLPPSEPVTPLTMAPVAGFTVQQVELGYQGLAALFSEAEPTASIGPQGPAICLRSVSSDADVPKSTASDVDATADDQPAADLNDSDQGTGSSADTPNAEQQTPASTAPPGASEAPVDSDPSAAGPTHGGTLVRPMQPEMAGTTSTPGTVKAADPDRKPESSTGTETGAHVEPAKTASEQAAAKPPFPVPERLLIGTRGGGEPVYWHFGDARLANRHLLVFGTSGSGKTYGIQCLLAEMACAGLRSLIIDYTNGFLPGQMQPRFQGVANPKSHFVRTERLPLNPFRLQRQVLDPSVPEIEEGSYEVATRIESIFASVFELGDQQSAAMIRSLQSGLDLDPAFSLDALLPRLRGDSPQGETLANKLEPLIQSRPFREGVESAWEEMLTAPEYRVHVLQLAGLAREIQKLVTEFVLWDLWDYAQSSGTEQRPIPIVLDEIQNLDHSSDSPIDKMLREGRKFGVALMLATQTTSNFNSSQRDRLFQAGHKLFFKPATTEIDRFAQILAQATQGVSKADWGQRLAKLEKGQCWSLGPVLRADGSFREEAVLVSVTALEQRGFEG